MLYSTGLCLLSVCDRTSVLTFLNFLQEGHFQIKRSADLEEEHAIRDIVIQEHAIVDFKMFRCSKMFLAESSEDVSW